VPRNKSGDKEFLARMDSVLRYGLMLGATFVSGALWQLFSGFSTRILGVLLILVGSVILPFLTAMKAFASDSVKTRILSWAMLVGSITVSTELYLYHEFWMKYAQPFFVPSVMTHADYNVWMTSFIDVIVIFSILTYSTRRIIRYFQRNLTTKFYRNQIPDREWVRRNRLKVFFIYWGLSGFALFLYFAP
jgi:hypothetical protein